MALELLVGAAATREATTVSARQIHDRQIRDRVKDMVVCTVNCWVADRTTGIWTWLLLIGAQVFDDSRPRSENIVPRTSWWW
jgi:hypothetical protein